MDDLISRQAAIKAILQRLDALALKGLSFGTSTFRDGIADGYARIMSDLQYLPSAQRWIPCSERLPEHGVSVLLSHFGYVSEDYLDIDDGAMYFWNSGIDLDEELNNLAWMPLPEPWKGEE